MAPDLLASRWASTVDVRMMHARDLARTDGLAAALSRGDAAEAARIVEDAGSAFSESPVLVGRDGSPILAADTLPLELLDATRRGEMPVAVVSGGGAVRILSLAPVEMEGQWVGAAGGSSSLDTGEAATLAALTRSAVLILDDDGRIVDRPGSRRVPTAARIGSPPRRGFTRWIVETVVSSPGGAPLVGLPGNLPQEPGSGACGASTPEAYRPMERRDHPGPGASPGDDLRRPAGPTRREPRQRSRAVGGRRLRGAPPDRRTRNEVTRVSGGSTRCARLLRSRLAELGGSEPQMEAGQSGVGRAGRSRLLVLQAELVQRDRLASAGRLLAQLAHEIRNPIASIRNCLEVLRRRTAGEPERTGVRGHGNRRASAHA